MKPATAHALALLGISFYDCERLARIASTLHRWDELLCGTAEGHIEIDETTGKPWFVSARTGRRCPVPNRGAAAIKRLSAIMAAYPALIAYHQADPRGASLWIVRREDIPLGRELSQYYTRGTPVT